MNEILVYDFGAMSEKNSFQLGYIAEQEEKKKKIHWSLCATQW